MPRDREKQKEFRQEGLKNAWDDTVGAFVSAVTGKLYRDGKKLSAHHITPLSQGGGWEQDNCALVETNIHNALHHNYPPEDIAFITQALITGVLTPEQVMNGERP